MVKLYDPYEKYGIRRVVNAATSLTSLGGSTSPPEVFKAMEDASKSYVDIAELQRWAGERIAEATGAEAGLPTAGACNGLMLAAAACVMRGTELEGYDPCVSEPGAWSHLSKRLPLHTEGLKTEFIVQRCNRNTYDYAVECAGGRFKEVGSEDGTSVEELDAAFDPEKTAAYYFTARTIHRCLPLEAVVEAAHRHGVPVIVDAAAEIPPKRKLKYYIGKGADLVSYSGGKHIAGPNNSGLLAGRRDLIKLAHLQAYPFSGVGRVAKMSRETIVGLVTALKIYLEHDEAAALEAWEKKASWLAQELGSIPGVGTGIVYQRVVEDGEPMAPFCYLLLDEGVCGMTGRELVQRLKEGDPRVWTLWWPAFLIEDYHEKVCVNPQYMLEGEEEIVVQRIKELFETRS